MNDQNLINDQPDPFAKGLQSLAEDFRNGTRSIRSVTEYCLQQIERLDPALQAFEHVDADVALSVADGLDRLLTSGTDLGPLMGVPVAVKDIYVVEGMPTTNGSLHSADHINGPEGQVVSRLKRAGVVIPGKTKTVEFALGATGVNEARGTPVNPWDANSHRIPGGSSSGSAVATRTGMCGFALGTDTGGSVRIPSCFTSLAGFKPTAGLWPTDGIFPLSPTLDSAGPLCRRVSDARLIHQIVMGLEAGISSAPDSLKGIRFGITYGYLFNDTDDVVLKAFELAVDALRSAGAEIIEFDLPELIERETLFPAIVPAELLSALGLDHFDNHRAVMDSVTESRAAHGLDVSAVTYLQARQRRQALIHKVDALYQQFDFWLSPTCPFVPLTMESLEDPAMHTRSLLSSRNTQPGNLFELCGMSLPIQHLLDSHDPANPESLLPIGLQICGRRGGDTRLLDVCETIEAIIGIPAGPDLSGFVAD